MKTYTFELIIKEGNDEFWENLKNKTGCDETTDLIKNTLNSIGFDQNNSSITLKKFELEN